MDLIRCPFRLLTRSQHRIAIHPCPWPGQSLLGWAYSLRYSQAVQLSVLVARIETLSLLLFWSGLAESTSSTSTPWWFENISSTTTQTIAAEYHFSKYSIITSIPFMRNISAIAPLHLPKICINNSWELQKHFQKAIESALSIRFVVGSEMKLWLACDKQAASLKL